MPTTVAQALAMSEKALELAARELERDPEYARTAAQIGTGWALYTQARLAIRNR